MAQGLFTLKQVNSAIQQGGWSSPANYVGNFDGSTQYLITPTSANLTFGSGAFTIECWVYIPALATRGVFQTTSAAGFPGTQSGIGVYFGSSGNWNVYYNGTNYTISTGYSANQWVHLAVCRSGTTSKFFLNGVAVNSISDSTNYTQSYFIVGGFLSTTYLWAGQISNFRVLKGTALYTTDFTPPTNRLTAITNTQLLTLQDATIIDNSPNNFTLTNTGTVTASLQYPFSSNKTPAVNYLVVAGGGGAGQSGGGGGGGGVLAGSYPVSSGSAITVTVGGGGAGGTSVGTAGTSGSNSVLGAIASTGGGGGGTFNSSATTGNSGLSGGSGGGGAGAYTGITYGAAGQGTANQGNAGNISTGAIGQPYAAAGGGGAGTTGLPANSQNPAGNGGAGIASSINGAVTAYAGGGGGGAAGSSLNPNSSGGVGGGGGSATGGYGGTGTNGSTNTGGGGGGGWGGNGGSGGSGIVILSYPDIYAAASSYSNASVSTSGSGSLLFNGSSQWLTFATNSAWTLGSTFTIEAWIYPTAFSANNKRICQSDSGLDWNVSSGGALQFGGAATTSTLTLNAWTHVAAVVNSGTLSMYFNGVSQTLSGTTTGINLTASGSLSVGVYQTNNGYVWQGNISNFRIVKGSAVYTGNFTPSTTPLTAITNTQLLLNTVSGASCADSSANSFAPNSSASIVPTWNSASPFTVTGYKNRVYTWTSSGSITF